MRLRFVHLPSALVACLSLAAPARASSEWIVGRMAGTFRPDVTWEQVRSHMLPTFYASNPGERGVTAEGINNLRKIAIAQRRSQTIAQILIYDLDGDGNVTKEEIATAWNWSQVRNKFVFSSTSLSTTPSCRMRTATAS